MGARPKIGGTDARIQGEDACVVEDPLSGIENGDIILKRSLMESNNNFSGYGYRPGWGIINFFPCKNMGWWFERKGEIPFPVYESKCEKC